MILFRTITTAFPLGILVALFLAMLPLALPSASLAGKSPLRVGDYPPKISLTDLNGAPVRIPDDFRGKVLVIHFWTGGCSSCKEEMPAMDRIYRQYARKGLVILAVNVGEKKATVKSLAREVGVSYPVLLDPDKKGATGYDVVAVPRTYIVDRNGFIRYKVLGGASEQLLKKQILSLL